MAAQTLVVLALWLSTTGTLPLITNENGVPELGDYNLPDFNYEGQNYNWDLNRVYEKDTGPILETIIYYQNQNGKLNKGPFTAPQEGIEILIDVKNIIDNLKPSVDLQNKKDQAINKIRVERSSLYDELQGENNEADNGDEENQTMEPTEKAPLTLEKDEAMMNKCPQGLGTTINSKMSTQNKIIPTHWFWSWLFKSSLQEKEGTGEQKVGSGTETRQRPDDCVESSSLSSETGDTDKNVSSKSDHYNTQKGFGDNLTESLEKSSPDNFTTQIHKEEAVLEQEIMDHNPGITTTEAVWNTDEFIDKTLK